MRFGFIYAGEPPINAIDQATQLLCDAVTRAGHAANLVRWHPGRLKHDVQHLDVLVVPYNPFMWGRRGFAPRLVGDIAAVWRAKPRPKIVLIVHEAYVPVRSTRTLLMGAWQRFQLFVLVLLADCRFASIQAWADTLSRLRPTHHLPSGSNLPDARTQRGATRSYLNVDAMLVVATLTTGHPSQLTGYVESALHRLARAGISVAYLRLGAGASAIALPDGVREIAPGAQPAGELASFLAASDVMLTPFADGVSTRRGSVMAGLCQGVAVVGTSGPLTDAILVSQGLELVEVGGRTQFADRVLAIARDPLRRFEMAAAGRCLFEREFTWTAIAKRLLDELGG